MAKSKVKSKYVCQECGYETAGYLGKCPECGAWGSIVEEVETKITANTAVADFLQTYQNLTEFLEEDLSKARWYCLLEIRGLVNLL